MGDMFSSSLLQWCPGDETFREIAFAILCLVNGGNHVTAIPSAIVEKNGVYGFNKGPPHDPNDTGFMSCLATGAHVRGSCPGSSPLGTVYWLDDVLIFLTTQLYRPGALDNGVSCVFKYCQENHPNDVIDAILISIEHVVLVHIVPDVEIQHSSLLPLLDIQNHITLDVKDRYASTCLEKKQGPKDDRFTKREQKKIQKAQEEMMCKTSGFRVIKHDDSDEEDESSEESDEEEPALHTSQAGVEGNPFITFYALCHVFESAARRRMPPERPFEGCLPNELYPEIFKHVLDNETRATCMQVSRAFRNIYQANVLFADGIIMEPSESCKACDNYRERPEWLNIYDVASGARSKVELREGGGGWSIHPEGEQSFMVAVGKSPDTLSLLPRVTFRFRKVVPKQPTDET